MYGWVAMGEEGAGGGRSRTTLIFPDFGHVQKDPLPAQSTTHGQALLGRLTSSDVDVPSCCGWDLPSFCPESGRLKPSQAVCPSPSAGYFTSSPETPPVPVENKKTASSVASSLVR